MADEETFRTRVSIVLVLGGIFALALFIRSYFVYDLALGDFLLSGGSDAFYYRWTIDHIVTTGKHLLRDGMLNYPLGMNNPRPPVYGWSVSLVGMLLGSLQGSLELGIAQSFLFSTAVWGALTIFPTYFLGRDIFGRRAGLVGAFFLALMPAHIQRSPLSNGDHDAMVLFFVVTAFYFFLRALRELRQEDWVTRWTSPRAVGRGLRQLVLGNRRTILFSVMAGAAVAAVALTWQGWAYAAVVIMAYFIVQLLVHQARNEDPLGVFLAFTVTMGTGLLLAAPYYVATGFVRTWFDIPLILFVASFGLGALFTVFHRLPWVLVIPPVLLGFAGGLVIASYYSSTVASALSSGFGYFISNKVYETIAEAQPPELSQAILSFGAVAYYLAIIGIGWMAIQFVRRPRADYLFALSWSAAAIFMAMSAVRFIFNASPAFALTSAWITVLLVERLGFEKVRRAVAATGGSRLTALRRGIKVRHVAGAAFVALLLVLPNVWYGVDAAIPFERKAELDQQLYNAIPSILQPAGYQEGGLFYFGAFGYNLPLKRTYFPQAWEWFRAQDADVFPLTDRPAFLSWWDYGFEAVEEGRHPTVADNFQNGYEYAGHFLLAQSENEGLAVLNVRLLHGDLMGHGRAFSVGVQATLQTYGLDADLIQDVLVRPSIYIPLIRADPDRFGQWDDDISRRNARVIYLKAVLTETLDVDGQAELYRQLREVTGLRVDYFAVDSRLVPFSGSNTGIFYAPVKLTDHRTAELAGLRSVPVDFYRLVAETADGREFDLQDVPPTAQISNVRIEYRAMFYNSMLYRIFFGQKGSDVGLADEGLPAIEQPLSDQAPLHGYMLNHFRLAYRTAYFNPHPPEEVLNYSNEWTATGLFEAQALQEQIAAGETVGTVDLSPSVGLRQGIVVLRYYDGAILQGRVTAEDGRPLEGVRVTVQDEEGIPHDTGFTDAQGDYELLMPYGEVRVTVSTGELVGQTRTGNVPLADRTLVVSEAQAARVPQDQDGDGRMDYRIRQDFVVPVSSLQGTAFGDGNRDGVQDPGDAGLEGLRVEVQDGDGNVVATAVTEAGGTYAIGGLLPGSYRVVLLREGTQLESESVTLAVGQTLTHDLAIPAGHLVGTLRDEYGMPAVGGFVDIVEEATGQRWSVPVDADGDFDAAGLVEGNYTIQGFQGARESLPDRVRVPRGLNATRDLIAKPLGEVAGRIFAAFQPAPFASISLQPRDAATPTILQADAEGRFQASLPVGTYDAYALYFRGAEPHSVLAVLTVATGGVQSWDVFLQPAVRVFGQVTREGEGEAGVAVTFAQGPASRMATTGEAGLYSLHLPRGLYRVWALHPAGQYVASHSVGGTVRLDIPLATAELAEGRVFYDRDGNGTWDVGEGLEGVRLTFAEEGGVAFTLTTGAEGTYLVPLLPETTYTLTVEEAGFFPLSLGPFGYLDFLDQADLELRPEPVHVDGVLTPLDALDLEGAPVTFVALGEGAVAAQATADATGSFAADLLPGRYAVDVDAPAGGNEAVRIQLAANQTLQIPVGREELPLTLDVVKRVQLNGSLEVAGSPLQGSLLLRGPEEVAVGVDGSFAAHVRPGAYTLFSSTSVGGMPYVLLEQLNVTTPLTFNASLTPAARLEGHVTVEEQPLSAAVDLTFLRADGAALTVLTDAQGGYEAALGPGNYTASLTWRGVDRVEGPPRFVRYDLTLAVAVAEAEDQTLDLPVTRTLDNATVDGSVLLGGSPAAAVVTFEATNATAIDASFATGGTFAASLAPGRYDVYAFRESGKTVNLTSLTVQPGTSGQVVLRLEPGYRIAGIVSLPDGSRTITTLTFAAEAGLNVSTDDTGVYEAYLPAGTYGVTARLQRDERGVSVEYSLEDEILLTASTSLNLQLERKDDPAVTLAWDDAQQETVAAGSVVTYTLTLRNAGNVDDRYELTASVPGWTFDFDPQRVTLPFGPNNEVGVEVRITTPLDALVEHPSLVVRATSLLGTNAQDLLTVDVGILQVRRIGLRLAAEPPTLTPEALEISVELANPGNGPDVYGVLLTNVETLTVQGWQPQLQVDGEPRGTSVEGLEVGANETQVVTLRLEVQESVGPSRALLRAFSQDDPEVEVLLEVPVSFPSLSIPLEDVVLEGPRVRLGGPSFPLFLYGSLAVAAAVVAVLLLTRRRRRRR